MTTANTTSVVPTAQPPSQALARLSEQLGESPDRVGRVIRNMLQLAVKNRVPTADELTAFCIVCAQYQLNPLTKEIAGFISQTGQIVPILMIDGWHKIVNSRPDFNGYTMEYTHGDKGELIACTVNIFVKGRDHPATAVAFYSECKRNTLSWNTGPHRMLFIRAYCYAARAAFGLGAIYDPDDGEVIIANEAKGTPTVNPVDPPESRHEAFKRELLTKHRTEKPALAPAPAPTTDPVPTSAAKPETVEAPKAVTAPQPDEDADLTQEQLDLLNYPPEEYQ